MNRKTSSTLLAPSLSTRRHMLTSLSIAVAALAMPAVLPAKSVAQNMAPTPPDPAHAKLTALHLEALLNASPQRIYDALLDARQFAAFSTLPAEIDPKAGGAFTLFSGQIAGRNVELVPAQRIVQAWRPTHWDPGVYSIVKFEFKPQASTTNVILDHTGFPEGDFDALSWGWHHHYLDPMKRFFS